jgi:hypothetical protein
MKNQSVPPKEQLKQIIVDTIRTQKPQTTRQLIDLLQQQTALPREQITQALLELENADKINFNKAPLPPPKALTSYAFSAQALWFWVCTGFCIVTMVSLLIPADAYPWAYLRSALSAVFALFLPGFSLTKTLFPNAMTFKIISADTDKIERFVVSLGLSLALLPVVALLLNFTPWGIRLTPLASCLLVFTVCFLVAGLVREYQTKLGPKTEEAPRRLVA